MVINPPVSYPPANGGNTIWEDIKLLNIIGLLPMESNI